MAAGRLLNHRLRKDFGKIRRIIEIPNLIEIQKSSYERFLQKDVEPERREDVGLQAVFKSVFPIKDFNKTSSLEFVGYTISEPKYDEEECRQRGMTFAVPIKVTVRLVVWDQDKETGARSIRHVKEQEVYFGELPLMTQNGTFIINGTERVIVSQLHRSPGVFYDHDKGKTHPSGKLLYSARVIPYRGSWLDFEFDPKDVVYVRIDRRRKIPATVLLRALFYPEDEERKRQGLPPVNTTQELLNFFYPTERVFLEDRRIYKELDAELSVGLRAAEDLKARGEVVARKGRKLTKGAVRRLLEAGERRALVDREEVIGRIVARDIVDPKTGEALIRCNEALTEERLEELRARGISQFGLLFIDDQTMGPYIRNTMMTDRVQTPEEAIIEIYKKLRPGAPPSRDTAARLFYDLFFNADRYDLSRVGRLKLNHKLGLTIPLDVRTLRKEDILHVVKYLVALKDARGVIDDIDHLGNRRVRAIGELLENQYRIGLVRMERAIKERMSLQDADTLMPHDLINAKPVSAVVKEFFGSSQLSQFMDQTNPLSEVTHKRRLSALGPGGLTRERAGFEVRDVHPTHYGRICPIETPEGPNIGLIASLSTYARVNDYGFIETPYREVRHGRVTEHIRYISALEEEGHVIAQANAPMDRDGRLTGDLVSARKSGTFTLVSPDEVDLMDVSPMQLVSVAASLIPFLQNDDANRALMGSNMQRQAVPLLRTEAPLIGPGIEDGVARGSGVTVVARRPGVVESVDASRIVIRAERSEGDRGETGVDIYNLIKYQRSNQNTCINQKPIVLRGERVRKGQVIADGPATDQGELALGRNVLVAFMPWGGYNFEDSILISERVVKDDIFTSIHIEEFECVARDTKLGKEEVTRDIPNVGEEALKDLDESGIVRIGAYVRPGDILVGKITPKGETQLSPEEKLLRAIFGEKAGDVKDTSLRVPPGVEGIVINAKVFARRGVDKDDRSRTIEDREIQKLVKDQEDEVRVIQDTTYKRIRKLLVNRTAAARLVEERRGAVLLKKGQTITEELLDAIPVERWADITVEEGDKVEPQVAQALERMQEKIDLVKMVFEEKINRLKKGDELPPGVIKMVKVYVATKRKLSVGDKMAGRHGNKGVISRILPEEDMPYLGDGTAADLVLNPLGVPSRMNVGQILETHLGWAAQGLGRKVAELADRQYSPATIRRRLREIYDSKVFRELLDECDDEAVVEVARSLRGGIYIANPVFDGATETEIKEYLERAGLPVSGQTALYDGRTGEPFHQRVTVGAMYMMKLHHLVDDKIHARSTGPYSLVTQQPLGGKAQFGGQRLGEMEVWAMEAYGAAHALQEFLTVKSDDVIGRTRMYESIVKGDCSLEPSLPESFNVLVKELQSLCLDVELLEEQGK
ncbi:MAG: DNA-directed RNA polymerase subunit beta [Deltaproteobacteria bacterium]|nr:DNA-directed RNA polymerase subunit beta [Deltaproteobacteria bacterium]